MSARRDGLQKGVSLIELMIALAIGSFLILGLVRVFSASRMAYQLSEGVSRVQENGRFAVDFIQRDLRMVGHMGCVNDQAHLQNVGALVSGFNGGGSLAAALTASQGANSSVAFPISLQAYEAAKTTSTTMNLGSAEASWSPALPSAVSGLGSTSGGTTLAKPVGGSDVLQMRFLAAEGLPVTGISISGSGASATSTLSVPAGRWGAFTADGVASPTMFGISDCSYVNLFNASAVNAATGQVTANLSLERFTPQPSGETMLYRIESVVYYVGLNASGTRSLYRARALASGNTNATGTYGAPEELVEGVESIQVRLGLDTNVGAMPSGPPSGYVGNFVRPSTLGNTEVNWRAVGAVQLGLLMASANPAATGQTVPNRVVLGTSFTPANTSDNRYRFSYETTVAMRNRLYGN